MQRWDFTSGSNFIIEMQRATEYSKKLILVLSEDFLKSKFTSSEWSAFFSKDPDGSKRLIIPIRVKPCRPNGLLASIVYVDFVGRKEKECKQCLDQLLAFKRLKPEHEPVFPNNQNIHSLLSDNYPTLMKPYGSRKNAPKRLAKKYMLALKMEAMSHFILMKGVTAELF